MSARYNRGNIITVPSWARSTADWDVPIGPAPMGYGTPAIGWAFFCVDCGGAVDGRVYVDSCASCSPDSPVFARALADVLAVERYAPRVVWGAQVRACEDGRGALLVTRRGKGRRFAGAYAARDAVSFILSVYASPAEGPARAGWS